MGGVNNVRALATTSLNSCFLNNDDPKNRVGWGWGYVPRGRMEQIMPEKHEWRVLFKWSI